MRKKIITALFTGLLVVKVIVSVSAAEVSDVLPDNATSVTANITNPGAVSYTITIPASISFGTLTQPDNNGNSYVYKSFMVEAEAINIQSNQFVSVWVKDSTSTDGKFYLTQTDNENPKKFSYDIYQSEVNDGNIASSTPLNNNTPGSYGYSFCNFASGSTGSKVTGTLVFNQNQLYGQEISDIAGNYSGTISFHSALQQSQ